MGRAFCYAIGIAGLLVSLQGNPAAAQKMTTPTSTPDHIRGQIAAVDGSRLVLRTREGRTVTLRLLEELSVFRLSRGQLTDVTFGTYVGSIARRLDAYSPIVRDSLSWLHEGFELRVIDDQLRGIALGHIRWDLSPGSTMTHGWVDDIEGRVFSIKYGPTEEEETDVDIPRDAPVLRMSLGSRSLLKPGAEVFAGAQKGPDGTYVAAFVFIGEDGIVPPL